MKSFTLWLSAAVCLVGLTLPAHAATLPNLDTIQVLPLPSDAYLIRVAGNAPVDLEITEHNGHSALWFEGACFTPSLFDAKGILKPAAYVRPTSSALMLQKSEAGCWLETQSSKTATFHVVGNADAFLAQAARLLPLYTSWAPKKSPQANAKGGTQNLDIAYQAFNRGDTRQTITSLERVFLATPNPPERLYDLLGAMYLSRDERLKALCLYAQGAKKYPETLGLRYAALLYRLKQPNKSIQALNDIVNRPKMSLDNLAQANYMLGSLYAEQQRYTEAIPFLKKASSTYANNPTILYNLAVSYQGSRQPDLALATYEKALPVAPTALAPDIQARISALRQSMKPFGLNES